jgi:hypothetical protein
MSEIARSMGVDELFVPSDQAGVDRLHAYRVLVHAEVEAFIEALCETILDVTENRVRTGVLTHAGHHLVVHWAGNRLRADAAKARYPLFDRRQAVLRVASSPQDFLSSIAAHRDRIRNNHGAKAANVRQLLLPLGYRELFFSPGLLDLLDDFGAKRGAVAHTTGLVGAQNWPTGSTELARSHALLPGLKRIEQAMPILLQPA